MKCRTISQVVLLVFLVGQTVTGEPTTNPNQHLTYHIRILQGDPLGSKEAGTLKVLASAKVVNLINRPIHMATGADFAVKNGSEVEHVPLGWIVALRTGTIHNDSVKLDITLAKTDVTKQEKEKQKLHTESTRSFVSAKFGETMKVRWNHGKVDHQTWIELSVVDPRQ
jgi:hypothetical protein